MAALESKLAAGAEEAEAAAAERRRRSLRRLLRQAAALRSTLTADGLVTAEEEETEEAGEEAACWAGEGEELSEGTGRKRGSEDEQATEEELVVKAQARYARAVTSTPPQIRDRAVAAFCLELFSLDATLQNASG